MGGRGSFYNKSTASEAGREFETTGTIGDVQIIQLKNRKQSKMPVESNTPNRTYVIFNRRGDDVKDISVYGAEGNKEYSIHTGEHYGLSPHYHKWSNGRQSEDAYPLTKEMEQLLKKVRNFEK